LIVRASGDPLNIAPAVRQAVRELEPAAPLSNVATAASLVDQSLLRPQSLSMLVTSFAGVALLLSIICFVPNGLPQRTQSKGSARSHGGTARVSLGAAPGDGVFGEECRNRAAFAATRLMSSLLFGVARPIRGPSAVSPDDAHRRASGVRRPAGAPWVQPAVVLRMIKAPGRPGQSLLRPASA
jgi:hypothetical protein